MARTKENKLYTSGIKIIIIGNATLAITDFLFELFVLFIYTFNEEYKYVIISPNEFSGTLNNFVDYKNNRNISTKLVTLSEVYSGSYFPVNGRDDAEKIKYFIKNAYDNWGTQYVLFVGGDDYFPTREVHIYVDYNEGDDEVFISDLYFVDLYNSDDEFVSWDSNGNNVFGEYDWGSPPKNDEFDLFPDVCLGRLVVQKLISSYRKAWFG